MISVDEARECRTMPMNIYIHKKPIVCLFIELSELGLLVVSVFIIIYQQLGCSY